MVTGANGFVGRVLVRELMSRAIQLRAVVRHTGHGLPGEVGIGEVNTFTRWESALRGVDCIIHLAGRVHVIDDAARDPLRAYREVNVAGTRRLAEEAVRAGVRRFIFISSIRVNGERTHTEPFRASDEPMPEDPYGISKLEAERALREVSDQTGLEVVVIRPPLVYGPGVKGNFRRLMSLVEWGMPLPLGSINNRRSMVSVFNLCDLIIHCIEYPAAANGTFLVSDGEDVSTPDLIRRLAETMGRRAWLLPVPERILGLAMKLVGRQGEFIRLCGSLQVDRGNVSDVGVVASSVGGRGFVALGGSVIGILTTLGAFFGSLILTGQLCNLALSHGMLDQPNDRSSHSMPTPRGGGLAIVVVFVLTALF